MDISACGVCAINSSRIAQSILHGKYRMYGLVPRHISLHDGQTVVHMWMPARIGSSAVDKEDARGGSSRWLLQGSTSKQRESIVLLHGFGASAVFQWTEQISALVNMFDLYIPDLLFFGSSHSELPSRSEVFQAETVAAALDRVGVRRFGLVGLSYGGIVAFRLAQLLPKTVARVLITDSPGPVFTKADYSQTLDRLKVKDIAELLLPDKAADVQRLMNAAFAKPHRMPLWVLKHTHEHLFTNMVDEKRKLLHCLHQKMFSDALSAETPFEQPAMVIFGSMDAIFPPEIATRLASFLGPATRVEIMEGAGHMPNMERPRQYNKLLKEFFHGKVGVHTGCQEDEERGSVQATLLDN